MESSVAYPCGSWRVDFLVENPIGSQNGEAPVFPLHIWVPRFQFRALICARDSKSENLRAGFRSALRELTSNGVFRFGRKVSSRSARPRPENTSIKILALHADV